MVREVLWCLCWLGRPSRRVMAAASIPAELEQVAQLARMASGNVAQLANIVGGFARVNPMKGTFVATLKDARSLLAAAGGNVRVVETALKGANVPARDLKLITRQLNSDMDAARKSTMGFGGELKGVARVARDVWNVTKNLGERAVGGMFSKMKSAGGAAVNLVGAGLHKAAELGEGLFEKVMDTAQFKEASMKGLAYILGGGDKGDAQAKMLFAETLKLAQKAPIADRDIVSAVKDFTTQGYKPEESLFLTKVMADQQSKFLEDPRVMPNFITAFTRGQGRGQANNRDLESLRIAKFRQADVLQELLNQPGMEELQNSYKGGKYKVKDSDWKHYTDEGGEAVDKLEGEAVIKLKKILASGMVNTATLQNAAIASLYKGKNLDAAAGELAGMKAETTLTGAVNNATNSFENLLLSMDLAGSDGMIALRDFLHTFTDTMGKSDILRTTITRLVDAVLQPLSKFTRGDLERVIETVGEIGTRVANFFKEAWGWLDKLVHAEPGEFLSNVQGVLVDVGRYVGRGMYDGFKEAALPAFMQDLKDPDLAGRARASIEQAARNASRHIAADANMRSPTFGNELRTGRVEGQSSAYDEARAKYLASLGGGGGGTPSPVAISLPSSTPAFAEKGTVPGPYGSKQIVIAEGGEKFGGFPGRGGGGGGPMWTGDLILHVAGDVRDVDALSAALRPMIVSEMAAFFRRYAEEG